MVAGVLKHSLRQPVLNMRWLPQNCRVHRRPLVVLNAQWRWNSSLPQLSEAVDKLAQATSASIEEAKALHPYFYTDESYAETERKCLYGTQWFAAAHTADLPNPGDVKVIEVGETSIILTRDKDRKLNAFYNVCRHRGAKVCSSDATGCKQLVCPYHWWAYRLDGSLKSTPPAAMPKERKDNLGLRRVPGLETFAGLIFLNQQPSPPPLMSILGDLPEKLARYDLDDLTIHGVKSYDIEGDWKLVAENFVDFYHVNAVHPELARFSKVSDHKPYQGKGQYIGFVTTPLTDCGGPGDSDNFNPFPRILPIESSAALFFQIFPNVSLTIYPHSVYTLMTFPSKTAGKTHERLTLLMHKTSKLVEDSDEVYGDKCNALMDFVTNINDEDVEAIENLQKGLFNARNKDIHGEFLPMYDWPIHRFQNMVIAALRGAYLDERLTPDLTTEFEADVVADENRAEENRADNTASFTPTMDTYVQAECHA